MKIYVLYALVAIMFAFAGCQTKKVTEAMVWRNVVVSKKNQRIICIDRYILPSHLSTVAMKMMGIHNDEAALDYLSHRVRMEPARNPQSALRSWHDGQLSLIRLLTRQRVATGGWSATDRSKINKNDMKIIDEQLMNGLAEEAKKSPRLRKNYNFHQSLQDKCHRFLNALEPSTFIPVHHHPDKDETFVILKGKVRVTTYNDKGEIVESCVISQESGRYGVDIPKNVWHGLECLEPSVLLECKAGPFVEHEVDGILEVKPTKDIYLAGGCFWGTEHYFKQIEGVALTEVGFANGHTENPTYKEVYTDQTGFAETVFVRFYPDVVSLEFLLQMFFKAIDPTSLNKQGHDEGTRYRTGVYYTDPADLPIIEKVFAEEQKRYEQPLVVEKLPLQNFYTAEEYHQDYLDKNPDGYCHLPLSLFEFAKKAKDFKRNDE